MVRRFECRHLFNSSAVTLARLLRQNWQAVESARLYYVVTERYSQGGGPPCSHVKQCLRDWYGRRVRSAGECPPSLASRTCAHRAGRRISSVSSACAPACFGSWQRSRVGRSLGRRSGMSSECRRPSVRPPRRVVMKHVQSSSDISSTAGHGEDGAPAPGLQAGRRPRSADFPRVAQSLPDDPQPPGDEPGPACFLNRIPPRRADLQVRRGNPKDRNPLPSIAPTSDPLEIQRPSAIM